MLKSVRTGFAGLLKPIYKQRFSNLMSLCTVFFVSVVTQALDGAMREVIWSPCDVFFLVCEMLLPLSQPQPWTWGVAGW